MGMELLRQQAAKQGVAIEVSKEPLETVFTKETTYVVTRELAQAYHLDLTQQNLYVVTSFWIRKSIKNGWKEELIDVLTTRETVLLTELVNSPTPFQ